MTYEQLMGLANGYADSKVLLIANELGVFTAIGSGGRRGDTLARSCRTTQEGMRLLLQALAGLGLLRQQAGRYWNTPLALKFLDNRSPLAITNLLWLLNHHWSDWTGMARAIRRGRPGWAAVTKTAEFRRRFALAMQEHSHVLAPPTITSFRLPRNAARFLDLGGGAGSYAIAPARHYPTLQGLPVASPDISIATAGWKTIYRGVLSQPRRNPSRRSRHFFPSDVRLHRHRTLLCLERGRGMVGNRRILRLSSTQGYRYDRDAGSRETR